MDVVVVVEVVLVVVVLVVVVVVVVDVVGSGVFTGVGSSLNANPTSHFIFAT